LMRQRALAQGYSLSEWGLKKVGGEKLGVVPRSEATTRPGAKRTGPSEGESDPSAGSGQES
jgi:hypothetical protein